jgi:hypothetical protein
MHARILPFRRVKARSHTTPQKRGEACTFSSTIGYRMSLEFPSFKFHQVENAITEWKKIQESEQGTTFKSAVGIKDFDCHASK